MITQSNGLVYPSCEVLVNGQKRKVYGKDKNRVYLNNGDQIQLKVYNPLTTRVGFQLKMNGQNTDDSILVVNPGQSVVIERFIGTNRKIVFNTYLVDKNNSQTKKAIKENGKLEIIFYSEYVDLGGFTVWGNKTYIPPNPSTIPYNPPTIPYNPPYVPSTPYPNPIWYISETYTDNIIDPTLTSNYCVNNISNGTLNSDVKSEKTTKSILSETGRVEKGNRSNQYFSQTEFKTGYIIKTYLFKLKPFSKNDVTINTTPTNPYIIQNPSNSYVRSEFREYCPNKRCNYRIRKSNWSYCPICGTKIE